MLKQQPSAYAQIAQRRRPGAASERELQSSRNKTLSLLYPPVKRQVSAPKTSSVIPSVQAGVTNPVIGRSRQLITQVWSFFSNPRSSGHIICGPAINPTLPGRVIGASNRVLQELKDVLQRHEKKLVVLMCQASSCRPCKMFARKYQRIAAEHCEEGAVFLEILGDKNNDTRDLMISMQIWATPFFCLFRGNEMVKTVTGINAEKLRDAIKQQLAEVELLP